MLISKLDWIKRYQTLYLENLEYILCKCPQIINKWPHVRIQKTNKQANKNLKYFPKIEWIPIIFCNHNALKLGSNDKRNWKAIWRLNTEQTNKQQKNYRWVEYYSTLKRQEILIHATNEWTLMKTLC